MQYQFGYKQDQIWSDNTVFNKFKKFVESVSNWGVFCFSRLTCLLRVQHLQILLKLNKSSKKEWWIKDGCACVLAFFSFLARQLSLYFFNLFIDYYFELVVVLSVLSIVFKWDFLYFLL